MARTLADHAASMVKAAEAHGGEVVSLRLGDGSKVLNPAPVVSSVKQIERISGVVDVNGSQPGHKD